MINFKKTSLLIAFIAVFLLPFGISNAQSLNFYECGLNFSNCDVSGNTGLTFISGQCQGDYSPCAVTLNDDYNTSGTIINLEFTANPTFQDSSQYNAWIQCYDNDYNNLGPVVTSWTSNAPNNGIITYDSLSATGYEFTYSNQIQLYRPCDIAEINVTTDQTVTFNALVSSNTVLPPVSNDVTGNIVFGIAIIIFIMSLLFWHYMWVYLMPK